jgi:putative DNA primase/helicase
MRKRGLIPPRDIQGDGKIHRCDVIGKRGKDDGSYLLFATGKVPAGGFQNFKDGLGWENWRYDLGRQTLTAAAEEYDLRKKRAIAERECAEKAQLEAAAAERRAHCIWSRARGAGDHPYLAKKKIKAYGTRIFKSVLVVPANGADGKLRGLQFIDAYGKKLWMKGSRPAGAFYQIGAVGDRIAICEGFATGATIHATTGHAVIVAFSAGNLKAVAEAVRRKYPSARIIIGADDDHEKKNNPGRYAGLSAALAIDAEITDPSWNTKLGPGLSDFNDLAVSNDPDFVRSAFQLVATPADFLERKLVANPFDAFDEAAIRAVVDIKARDRAAFERIRDALKKAGARTAELDKLWGEVAEEKTGEVDAKQSDLLVGLASEAELFHAADLTAYATISRNGHRETYAIASHGFKSWLRHRFYEEMKRSPGSETFKSALGTIEAKAIFSGEEHEVHLRVAEHGGAIFIDLGDKDWRVIESRPRAGAWSARRPFVFVAPPPCCRYRCRCLGVRLPSCARSSTCLATTPSS